MRSKLPRAFYSRSAKVVARDLLGKILVHRMARGKKTLERRVRIVEVEAYVGTHDLACHASKGRTPRTEVMFGSPGHAYVYLIYGIYNMFNIVCADHGDAQAVLIRAAEPLDGWRANLSGPGKFAREMKISRRQNGLDLCGDEIFLLDAPRLGRVTRTKRIGVDYAKKWKHALLRFYASESDAISKR